MPLREWIGYAILALLVFGGAGLALWARARRRRRPRHERIDLM